MSTYRYDADEGPSTQPAQSNHQIGTIQTAAAPFEQWRQESGQQQAVVDDNDEPMDIDDEDATGLSYLQTAVDHYEEKNYQSAASSLELWRKEQSTPRDDLYALSVAADQALCRFRASADFHFKKDVLYREAILANKAYLSCIQKSRRKDLVEAALLASISAIWIHTNMNNMRMARHKAWDILQWAVSVVAASGSEKVAWCNIRDSLVVLSMAISPQSLALRKFRHVLSVLDLVEEKEVSKLLERGVVQSRDTEEEASLADQEEAVQILARHKLGMKKSPASSADGITFKLSVLMRAANALTKKAISSADKESIENGLVNVCDPFNPSDLNILGCFEAANDAFRASEIFQAGLMCLRDDDSSLWRELTANYADCFARLGDHEQASDIFMTAEGQELGPPVKNIVQLVKSESLPGRDMLWRAVVSSSLDDDPVATLAATDKLHTHNPSEATALAHVFGLSQAGRPSLAQSQIQALSSPHAQFSCSHAHFVLTDEESLPTAEYKSKTGLIPMCLHSNCGVVLARAGSITQAITLFQNPQTCQMSCDRESSPRYLHPYYNLTLAYLGSGKTAEAVDLWEKTRDLSREDESIGDLGRRLQATVQKMSQVSSSRSTWTAKGIGGMLSPCVLLLDCFVLRYRSQEMEEEALHKIAY